jgi:copper(I)-binding protein
MKPVLQFFAFAALLAVLGAPAHAQEVKAGDLVITQPWSRATPGWSAAPAISRARSKFTKWR